MDTNYFLSSYEYVADRIIFCVDNAEFSDKERVVHRDFLDLTFRYDIALHPGTFDDAKLICVTKDMLNRWGISEDKLHSDAINNTPRLYKYVSFSLPSLFTIGRGCVRKDSDVLVVTNNEGMFGAAALFYPGVMHRLSEEIGGDYYILPSSKHEVLIVKDDGMFKTEELTKMVNDVNKSIVSPEDFLSNNVYRYRDFLYNIEIAK